MRVAFPPRGATPTGFVYGWPQAIAVLGAALLALGFVGAADIAQILEIWLVRSAYRHCPLVFLMSLYLIWQMRSDLGRATPRPFLGALLLCVGAGALWLIGMASELALLRHVALFGLLLSCVLLFLGKGVTRLMQFPLGYLAFAIPFGEEIVPFLQVQTAHISIALLPIFEIPAFLNGTQIATPNGLYRVAEACAGVQFLMAMLAYGALLGVHLFSTWRRRLAFLLLCVVVPILANGIRAFVTIYVGYQTTPSMAAGFDHIVYGWFFFAGIMLAMTVMALPFSDTTRGGVSAGPGQFKPMKGDDAPANAPVLAAAVLAFMLLMAGLPLWAISMARAPVLDMERPLALPQFPGWKQISIKPNSDWQPRYEGADQIAYAQYESPSGGRVDVVLAVYGAQREGSELVGHGLGAAADVAGAWIWSGRGPSLASRKAFGPVQRDILLSAQGGRRLVLTQYHIAGGVTGSMAGVKWQMVKARLFGGAQSSAALMLSARLQPGLDVSADILAFQAEMGPPQPLVSHLIAQAQP